jgi:hypothetical protein
MRGTECKLYFIQFATTITFKKILKIQKTYLGLTITTIIVQEEQYN